jgi:hypothetical protein
MTHRRPSLKIEESSGERKRKSLNFSREYSLPALRLGCSGNRCDKRRRVTGVRKLNVSGTVLEKPATAGESPLCENVESPDLSPKYHGARGILWESRRTTS